MSSDNCYVHDSLFTASGGNSRERNGVTMSFVVLTARERRKGGGCASFDGEEWECDELSHTRPNIVTSRVIFYQTTSLQCATSFVIIRIALDSSQSYRTSRPASRVSFTVAQISLGIKVGRAPVTVSSTYEPRSRRGRLALISQFYCLFIST